MIKTKLIKSCYGLFEQPTLLDDLLNEFIESNTEIKVIDIKFQANVSYTADEMSSGSNIYEGALLIYEEDE